MPRWGFFSFGGILGNPIKCKTQKLPSKAKPLVLVHEATNSCDLSERTSSPHGDVRRALGGDTETGGIPRVSVTDVFEKYFFKLVKIKVQNF